MRVGRWWTVLALTLFVVSTTGAIACGGGDSDSDKIKARMNSFVDHLNKGDANGVINDIPPDARKGCDNDKVKQALGLASALGFKISDIKVGEIKDNHATANVKVSIGGESDASDDTSQAKFVKVGGNWYIDDEGKGCTDLIGS